MKKINYKGRCEKRKVSKCKDICKMYCDAEGNLLPEYPSIRRFRYFESQYRKQENYLISRNGLKNYQRNDRPLLGEGVQEFAPNVGVGMSFRSGMIKIRLISLLIIKRVRSGSGQNPMNDHTFLKFKE